MVLRHRDLLAGSPADRVPALGVLDEEVSTSCRLFAARDVGGHLFVDGVLGNAGWGILLFELVQCVWRRFVRARAPERFVRVVAGERCTI